MIWVSYTANQLESYMPSLFQSWIITYLKQITHRFSISEHLFCSYTTSGKYMNGPASLKWIKRKENLQGFSKDFFFQIEHIKTFHRIIDGSMRGCNHFFLQKWCNPHFQKDNKSITNEAIYTLVSSNTQKNKMNVWKSTIRIWIKKCK